jgi:hypothetical protein
MLAKQIEREMHRASKDWTRYANEHGALYEKDLQYICPRKDKDRKKMLLKFAEQYGFRLRFYLEGVCAIFGKRLVPVQNVASALWLPVATPSLIREATFR